MFNIGCAPWFIAADVCKALGITNARDALAKCLDDEEKGVERIYTPGGPQNLRIVSESGMYALTMRSNKPQAKRWQGQQAVPCALARPARMGPTSTVNPTTPQPDTQGLTLSGAKDCQIEIGGQIT